MLPDNSSWLFKGPVGPVGPEVATDYYEIIKEPITSNHARKSI